MQYQNFEGTELDGNARSEDSRDEYAHGGNGRHVYGRDEIHGGQSGRELYGLRKCRGCARASLHENDQNGRGHHGYGKHHVSDHGSDRGRGERGQKPSYRQD